MFHYYYLFINFIMMILFLNPIDMRLTGPLCRSLLPQTLPTASAPAPPACCAPR